MQRRVTIRHAHGQPIAVSAAHVARRETRRWLLVSAFVALAGIVALHISTPVLGAEPREQQRQLPRFREVEKLVAERFGSNGREMNDLITRQETDELFAEIGKLGWKIDDRKEILARVPDEGEFFVQQLRSKRGNTLMRDIAPLPLGYDRVDRLSQLERGHRYVSDLVKGPDGYKLIQYMTETPWGKNMGKQLRGAPDGANFNKPTGRIYTAEQLLPTLHDSYAAEVKRRSSANTQASR
jgi:hypothetical protein